MYNVYAYTYYYYYHYYHYYFPNAAVGNDVI